jgi:alkylation response protein AidB-like acyl-CoA dehydrogenase
MKLTLEPEQRALQDTVRRFVGRHASIARVRELLDQDRPRYDAAVWRRACTELGLAGLLAAPTRGGAGAGLTEATLALEEFGAVVDACPLLSVSTAVRVLERAGDPLAAEYVPRLVAGDATAAVVFDTAALTIEDPDGPRRLVTGALTDVMDGLDADLFVVVSASGPRVVVVDAHAPGVSIVPATALDLTRRFARVRFDEVEGVVAEVAPALAGELRDDMAVLIGAELSGLVRSCLARTVDYVKSRVAFGRVVGSFQAIKHRLADMYCQLELVQSGVRAATWCGDAGDPEFAVNAAVALRASTACAVEVSTECLRMIGGAGFTWEHDAHFYVRRAHQDQALLGGRDATDRRLLALIR